MEIDGYAELVKLRPTEAEKKWMGENAAGLVAGLEVFDRYDLSGIEPLVTVLGDEINFFGDDVPYQALSRDELLAMAGGTRGGYYAVPRTVL